MAAVQISGRITRSDTQQGIQGIRVEAWAADDPAAERPLGWTLSNQDGSYRIVLPPSPDSPDACCDCPKVYLRLRDRDCRLIHDGCLDRRCCEPGQPLRIDVALAPQALWWHLSRPLAWARIDGPLLPPHVMQEIEDALELLQAQGLPAALTSLQLAHCAAPPIEGFDRILTEAWDTLQGDPQAARRYRDILEALCGLQQAGCCGGKSAHSPFKAEVNRLFDGACDEPLPDKCQEPEPCAPCTPAHCEDADCRCGAPLVSDDKALLLVMAALHLACGEQALARRWVEVLLAELARFNTLEALHGAARRALLGDAAARAHAKDLLELLCERCGLAAVTGHADRKSACVPRHPLDPCLPCLDPALAACLREAIVAWCRIHCFHVCEVRPPRACPGEEILIVGCGFGERAGQVVFEAQGLTGSAGSTGRGGIPGSVQRWCDDRISVTVPQGAGCGLWLRLPAFTIAVCGRFLDLRPIGCIDQGFEGTSAQILRFDIKGHAGQQAGECPLPPGEPLRIRWNTCAADRVRVEILDLASNGVIAVQDPAPMDGRWDFTATNFTRTTRLRVRITAFGRCSPPQVSRQIDLVFQKQPNLQIQGLEVTQAVQHYRADQHLTDPADRGPDNSLRLVTNKTAWVRAYLRSGQDPAFDNGQLAGVTGTLKLERRTGGVWNTVASIAQQNASYVAEDSFASYDAERGNINATLNFVVPASQMTGLLRFTVEARGPYAPCAGQTATRSTQIDVNLQQTLNAAFITIGYNGPNAARTGNIVLPAPTLATCQAETSWAMTTYPVSGAPNVRIAGSFVTNTPIDDPRSCPGCCSPNWGPLLTQVAALVALDQAANPGTWVYYGIIANGIPVNVPGCSGGATGGVAGQPVTYAHEIGHQFGLPHARCGNAGNGNPNYPVYEPYDLPVDPPGTTNWTMASVGEYGLDINNGAIANPSDFEDFMSYCGPRWISKFTYQFLTNIGQLTPVVVPTGAGAPPRVIADPSAGFEPDERRLQPLIHLMGTIGADGAVSVDSLARLETRYLRGDGRQTGLLAQHLDADGRVLAEDVLYAYGGDGGCGGHRPPPGAGKDDGDCHCHDDEDSGPVIFKAMLRDTAPGASLRIVRRKAAEVLWERKAPARPLRIGQARAALARDGGLVLGWKLEGGAKGESRDARDDVDVWVRWSDDEGKTWHALTVGLRGGEAILPTDPLPGGSMRFELLANDGFHTTRAVTEPLQLPRRGPVATLFHPVDGTQLNGDSRIHLWATAASADGRPLAADAARWFIDDRPVGQGLDLWVDSPAGGPHTIRLEVDDGDQRATAMARVDIQGRAEGNGVTE